MNGKLQRTVFHFFAMIFMIASFQAIAQMPSDRAVTTTTDSSYIISAKKIDPTKVELRLSNNRHMLIDFYGENIFRLFCEEFDSSLRNPQAQPPAQILINNPRKPVA